MKKTVLNLLDDAVNQYPNSPYTLEKGDSEYVPKTFTQVRTDARFFAAELYNLGIKKNDKIAILAEGRNYWVSGEFGILMAGAISVPLSIKLLPEEVLFRINHSESRAIILTQNTFRTVAKVWDKIKHDNFKLIYLDKDLKAIQQTAKNNGIDIENDILLYTDLLEKGKESYEKNKEQLAQIQEKTDEADIVTISYTSGTTGNPKGIMLTHLNYFSNSRDAMLYFDVKEKDRLMIILPIDHSFAHTVGIYASLVRGLSIYFVDARGGSMATLKNIPINLKEAKPEFMLTVPALSGNFMNKIKDGINSKGGFVKWLFNKGLEAGKYIHGNGFKKPPLIKQIPHRLIYNTANALIFKKVRQIFGGSLKYCVGGGALLDIKQQQFFYSIGIPIYQGYGLTEAAPIISTNTAEKHKMGSSGRVIPGVTCKIELEDGSEAKAGETGEIVIKGQNVMKGYYKNPEATDETIREGWLHTGDRGYVDKDNFLYVIGREKALLISDDGEKYSPEEIEEAIVNTSELVKQVMVYNDHKRYTTALITLEEKKVEQLVDLEGISETGDLLNKVEGSFYKFKKDPEYADKFPTKWTPSSFRIIAEPFSEENKMINSTMKMVRYKITEVYQDVIETMYKPEGNKNNCEHNRSILRKYIKK